MAGETSVGGFQYCGCSWCGGISTLVIKNYTAPVTSGTLEIRFYWTGKGTTGIPVRGVYGPLISAISVDPGNINMSVGRHELADSAWTATGDKNKSSLALPKLQSNDPKWTIALFSNRKFTADKGWTHVRIQETSALTSIFVALAKVDYIFLTGNLLTGPVPTWTKENLSWHIFDTYLIPGKVLFSFLTGNLLTGPVPTWTKENLDLSYNNFTIGDKGCQSQGSLFCLGYGNYTVNLHFAETRFTNGKTYKSLGRRIFDVYIQVAVKAEKINHISIMKCLSNYISIFEGIKRLKDFNIADEAGVVGKAVIKNFNASVTSGTLEIRFYWAGKGTTGIPLRGVYGPLISAISVDPDFDFVSQMQGLLSDGTVIAVKQLSSKSKQGNREFVNEIGMISALQHPHLVKLHGCCIEGNQLLLVYEYMENNSLARALFGPEESQLKLDWPTRHKICVGIARGLAYLHEESRLKVVHRDIKATNVLLDKNLTPKISDFGLAKLDEEDNTHISTRIAGTYGYIAPEYATRGYLTDKADVYSYGILVLEIVSGRNNTTYRGKEKSFYLLDWAQLLKGQGNLLDLVDPRLRSDFNKEEMMLTINVALLCCNVTSTVRPTMSSVVSMLEGRAAVQELVSDPNASSFEIEAMRKHFQSSFRRNTGKSQTQTASTEGPWTGSSTSAHDLYPVKPDSTYWDNRK
ncbi:probable leucine-rich repeat receptor-like serine/threonine-protein kinase At3g14840 [Prunus avium]|uniref:non-specific serine/threonine protein kinase n=1 Tax=Prunus avium TaxID=42229 RepID=A0A6P5T470_PRUAV|nr:probable leucine-rich repeat receptor-like serine/threonine-protein kinase At3g14840 [Prunus avium]